MYKVSVSTAALTSGCIDRLISSGIHLTDKDEFEIFGHPFPIEWKQCEYMVMKYDVIPAQAEGSHSCLTNLLQRASEVASQNIVIGV